MKNLILIFGIVLSLCLTSCVDSCNGPSGEDPNPPGDTTVIDTSVDTIDTPDTIIVE